MAKKRRFDFTKKNKRSGKVENVGYLDLEQDEEQSRCSLYFYGDIVSATWESMWYEEDRCPQDIADFLNQLDGYEDIDIYFNSGGGDVFAGLAIYNQLKRYSGHKVGYVDGTILPFASNVSPPSPSGRSSLRRASFGFIIEPLTPFFRYSICVFESVRKRTFSLYL